jgi:hypothetical protein
MKPTRKIDTKDVKVSSVIAQRPYHEKQVKDSRESSDQSVSNREDDAQVATAQGSNQAQVKRSGGSSDKWASYGEGDALEATEATALRPNQEQQAVGVDLQWTWSKRLSLPPYALIGDSFLN